VGQFSQANKWSTMGNSFISNTMNQVAQPVLVNADTEKGRQQRVFRKMLRFTALVCFPLMFGLAMVAHEFIITTIGSKWEPAVILLQILCLGGAFVPLHTIYQNLIVSKGRSDIYLLMATILIVLQIGVTLLLAPWGIKAMVTAFSLLNIFALGCWHIALQRVMTLSLLEVLKDTMPFALIAAMVMAGSYYATRAITPLWLLLASRVLLATVTYLAIMRLLNVTILKECLQLIVKKKTT
jgi:O-antigen/teichoic acid export membrane protein